MRLIKVYSKFFVNCPAYEPYEPGYYPVARFDQDVPGKLILALDAKILSDLWLAADYLQMERIKDDIRRSLYFRVSAYYSPSKNASTGTFCFQ